MRSGMFAIAVGLVTALAVAVPSPAVAESGPQHLVGTFRFTAGSWNRQEFNHGEPKPDGSAPGNTGVASGTYNAASGALSLTWASQIQGGTFSNFTGLWHLEGTFVPASGSAGSSSTAGGASGA